MDTTTLDDREQSILALLRQNSRQSLASISRKTGLPMSTVFDKKKIIEKRLISRYCAILDFAKLGYNIRNAFVLKPFKNQDNQKELLAFLFQHPKINNIYSLSDSGFFVECVFKNVKELFDFVEGCRPFCEKIEEHHIIEELKKEDGLSLVF